MILLSDKNDQQLLAVLRSIYVGVEIPNRN